MAEERHIEYKPYPTMVRFHASEARVRGLMGPVGSGKSVACVMELLMRARQQKPYHAIRRTHFAVIRKTYSELKTTTIRTWKEWIPESLCPLAGQYPIVGRYREKMPDDTTVDMEITFMGLEHDSDVEKLSSMDVTGVWINEAREVSYPIIKKANERSGRYPSVRNGGWTWRGVIMDTNPPPVRSWWYELAEIVKPPKRVFEFFRQPPAIVPMPRKSMEDAVVYAANTGRYGYPPAENVEGHPDGFRYWLDLVYGNSDNGIRTMLMGHYGVTEEGMPVYPDFFETVHVSQKPIEPMRGVPVVVGLDPGLSAAAVFTQLSPTGQLRICHEVFRERIGIRTFARSFLRPFVMQHYQGMKLTYVIDPTATAIHPTDEANMMEILEQEGFPLEPAPDNHFGPRREAVAYFMTRMSEGGNPAFLVSPDCAMLVEGFMGQYKYAEARSNEGGRMFRARPIKNQWSHVHDALQYAALYTLQCGSGAGGWQEQSWQTRRSPFKFADRPEGDLALGADAGAGPAGGWGAWF